MCIGIEAVLLYVCRRKVSLAFVYRDITLMVCARMLI